jgi:general stress protein 26
MSDEPKSYREAVQKLGALIKDVRFAMLTTQTPEGYLHSRPMATQQIEFDGVLWFLTSISSAKIGEVQQHHDVNLAYADSNADKYVSVAGTAEILRDREKLDELWSPFHTAWFPKGKDDPEIALIKVTVESAEYWNVPESKMVQVLGFAKAALTGRRYEPGEHGEVDLNKPAA